MASQFSFLPKSANRRHLFSVYGTNDIDLALFWNIPKLNRRGHHYIIGINLSVQQNPFQPITADSISSGVLDNESEDSEDDEDGEGQGEGQGEAQGEAQGEVEAQGKGQGKGKKKGKATKKTEKTEKARRALFEQTLRDRAALVQALTVNPQFRDESPVKISMRSEDAIRHDFSRTRQVYPLSPSPLSRFGEHENPIRYV